MRLTVETSLLVNFLNISADQVAVRSIGQTANRYVLLIISLTLRRLMSYTYGAPILDASRSHTTTQHSR